MEFELINGVFAIPLVLAIVEFMKKALGFEQKISHILALVISIVISFAYSYAGDTVAFESFIRGLVVGFAAIGLYSGAKNTKELLDR